MKEDVRIVKVGGDIINNTEKLAVFLKNFAEIKTQKILVHGGGKKASELIKKLGQTPKMIAGRRVTDAQTLDIITMVYAGLLNKNIVAMLQKNNCDALGLSGADARIIQAKKRSVQEIDYGFVGDIVCVDAEKISYFLDKKLTPVFCAITCDAQGQLLNTNADTIAANVAIALARFYKITLIYTFEKRGVLQNIGDDKSVLEHIDKAHYERLKSQKIISEGMLPKLENCFDCLEKGVQKIHIGSHTLLSDFKQKHTIVTL